MKRFFSSFLFFTILLLLGSFSLYAAETYLITSSNASLVSVREHIKTNKEQIARAAALKSAAASLDAGEAEVNSHFLNESNIVSYLGTLEKTGSVYGAQVQVVSVSADKGARPRAAVSLLVSGSFESVMRTIGTLEQSQYDTVVTGLVLNSDDAPTKGKTTWSAATILSVALVPEASTTKKP